MSAKTKQKKSAGRSVPTNGVPKLRVVKTNPPQNVSSAPVDMGEDRLQRQASLNRTLCIVLAMATFAIYFRATHNEFVNYDDQAYVVENTHIHQGLTTATIRWALTAVEAANWHPLTWMSHALDVQLFHMQPAGHHLTSIVLHLLNVALLFFLLAKATGEMARSFFVAALFALHPINVESVAWVAERKNVLCMFFVLLTLAAYGWYARRPQIGRYVLVAVSFALALAAKPMAVTLPFALLLVDFWPLRRVDSLPISQAFPVPQRAFRSLVVEKVPLLLLSLGSAVITLTAQRPAETSGENLPLLARMLNALYAYSMYLLKAIWPTRLAPFYPYEGYKLQIWAFFLCIGLLGAVSVVVLKKRSSVYMPVGWFWFLGTLVPMIGLVQVGDQSMADRYAYLPLIGIFVMMVWGVADLAQSRDWNPRALVAVGAAVLVVLSAITWRQIGFWHSSRELWFHALDVTKDNYMAEDYVGSALLIDAYSKSGERRLDEALVHFRNAARINPYDAISHLNLGADLHERGELKEAMAEYNNVLSLTHDPHLAAKAYIDMGAASQQLGDLNAAEQYYNEAEKYEPGSPALSINREKLARAKNPGAPKSAAEVLTEDASLMARGQASMNKKIRELAASAAAKPSLAAYLELGELQQAAGEIDGARSSFEMAVKLDPKSADAQAALNALNNQTP